MFALTNRKGMVKNSLKQQVNRKTPEEVVQILADKHDVSERYVQMVISGERKSETILADYMFYKQEHNLLLKSIKQAVPFN